MRLVRTVSKKSPSNSGFVFRHGMQPFFCAPLKGQHRRSLRNNNSFEGWFYKLACDGFAAIVP